MTNEMAKAAAEAWSGMGPEIEEPTSKTKIHLKGESTGSSGQIVVVALCGMSDYERAVWWEQGWADLPKASQCGRCRNVVLGSGLHWEESNGTCAQCREAWPCKATTESVEPDNGPSPAAIQHARSWQQDLP